MALQGSSANLSAGSLRPAVGKKRRIFWMPYLFVAPTVLLIVGFLFYPLLKVFYYSLQHYNLSKPYYNGYAGLDNFKTIFTKDDLFLPSLLMSFKWVLAEVSGQLVFGLIAALLLNQAFRFRGWFRAGAILPWAISGVITSLMWSLIFNQNMGILNDVLLKLGIIDQAVAWTANSHVVFLSVVIAELWRGIPFFMITLLAALQTVPSELYEACTVDGGGRWRAFVSITLPYLRGAIMLSTLLRAVWEFNNVDLIYNMTGGGPANKTMTLPLYIANEAIASQNFGYGSALTIVAFIILTIFALVYLKLGGFGKED